jgi:hypothetical protein
MSVEPERIGWSKQKFDASSGAAINYTVSRDGETTLVLSGNGNHAEGYTGKTAAHGMPTGCQRDVS